MISKAHIKEIRTLHQQKYRQMYNKFIAEGAKAAIEFIKSEKYTIHNVYLVQGTEDALLNLCLQTGITAELIHRREMEQISTLKTPGEVLLVLERSEDGVEKMLQHKKGILYLDGVQDPGNVGTIIRIADWFGLAGVARSADSADFFNPKVVQASMGSMNRVFLSTANATLFSNAGKTLIGTSMEGTPYMDASFPEDAVLVLGSEGNGICPEVASLMHQNITIPGSPHRIADSLNVSVAAGIITAHWQSRQRM